jgi:hypothetical protein
VSFVVKSAGGVSVEGLWRQELLREFQVQIGVALCSLHFKRLIHRFTSAITAIAEVIQKQKHTQKNETAQTKTR